VSGLDTIKIRTSAHTGLGSLVTAIGISQATKVAGPRRMLEGEEFRFDAFELPLKRVRPRRQSRYR
jgi:hypothetical protein